MSEAAGRTDLEARAGSSQTAAGDPSAAQGVAAPTPTVNTVVAPPAAVDPPAAPASAPVATPPPVEQAPVDTSTLQNVGAAVDQQVQSAQLQQALTGSANPVARRVPPLQRGQVVVLPSGKQIRYGQGDEQAAYEAMVGTALPLAAAPVALGAGYLGSGYLQNRNEQGGRR